MACEVPGEVNDWGVMAAWFGVVLDLSCIKANSLNGSRQHIEFITLEVERQKESNV